MSSINWRWPAKPGNNRVPLYTLLRRLACVPGYLLFRTLTWLFVLMGWGWRQAKYWWEDSA